MDEKEVLEILLKIPKGKVTTYKEIAQYFQTHPRKIASILRKNKDVNKYPCYKVVQSNGEVGGYNQGKGEKIKRLKKEGIKIKGTKIIDFEKVLFRLSGYRNKP